MIEPADPRAFDARVPPGGYRWWYLDALDDSGAFGLVMIAFVGSVFSPYYFAARQRHGDRVQPRDHCAINVCLYGPRDRRWTMTERRAASVAIERERFAVGPSQLTWRDGALDIEVRERSAPLARAVAGTIRVEPTVESDYRRALDPAGRHLWAPYAPLTRVRVRMNRPALRWDGTGYLDSNWGSEPLEQGFRDWHWSRAARPNGGVAIRYEARARDGSHLAFGLAGDPGGELRTVDAGHAVTLPRAGWGVARQARADGVATLERTLEDTPFYARSLLIAELGGERLPTMHESLSLERFRRGWVRMLLPFRMPREWRGRAPGDGAAVD